MSDLSTPLGMKSPDGGKARRPVGVIASVAVVALAASIGVYIIAVDDPLGGEPTSTARIQDVKGSVGRDEVTVVGVKSGSGQLLPPIGADRGQEAEVDAVGAPDRVRGPVGVAMPDGRVQSTSLPTAPLPELLEDGPHGPIPRISEAGLRPLDAYARPVAEFVGSSPRIAIVVGGLGLSQTGTQEALRQLPPEVTVAFAPYGSSLDRWTARARQDGHEILLQLPLEPFDYPDNDPGPHTLLADASPEKNADNLRWLLSRIGAYVGVIGYMGARYTSEPEAMQPVMAEIAGRGLMFVDDGSSLRSRTKEAAGSALVPFAAADLVVDQVADEAEIAGRLAQLEQIARARGLAVGTASALPVSVRTIGEWASTLERRGITLVPVSATLAP